MSIKNAASVRGLTWCIAAAAAMLGVVAPAHANLVNFDNLTSGKIVTNRYAAQDITFSSTGPEEIEVTAQPEYMSTPPNFNCTARPLLIAPGR